jgi:hypothetical protein
MKVTLTLRSVFGRLQLPAALLITLLQRLPVLPAARALTAVVAESPVGAVLRAALTASASLGALHSLAGATVLSSTQTSPITVAAGTKITPVAFTVTNTINIASWKITGQLPPGLALSATENSSVSLTGAGTLDATTNGTEGDIYGTGTAGIVSTTPALQGTPTQAGSYTFNLQAYESPALGGLASNSFSFTVNVTGNATLTAPTFSAQPQSQSAAAGGSVTFSATATGSTPITYQWNKNGAAISGATGTSLTLANLTTADAATYTLVATNSVGSATSGGAVLTVTAGGGGAAPTITMQPLSVTANAGGTLALVVSATNAAGYQWRKDGVNLAGATSSALVLSGISASNAGAYTVVVSNSSGSVTSSVSTVAVASSANFGRMINMSILTNLAAGGQFTVGTVLGGAGTGGVKPLLVRAVGPSLAQLGVGNPLADPKLDFFSGTNVIATNDNWNGDATITATAAQLGAFGYVSPTSKDAAVVFSGNVSPPASYTVQVSGVGGSSGTVLAELYDATPAASVTPATPRLVNLSVLKNVSSGETLTVGFVVRGDTACTVLLRAVGPGLVQLGVGGVMGDPKISLFNSASSVIAENDNWGGNAQVSNAGSSVGAFALGDVASKDAMMLITLPPSLYTVQVSGANGTAGQVVVEAYEVP